MKAQPGNVQDVYPLSPMQQGILFHSENGSDAYIEQMSFAIKGEFDADAFERAWRYAVQRHAILRTAFGGRELREPVQIVRTHVDLDFSKLDWRSLPIHEQQESLAALLESERRKGFDLARAPLIRHHLIRTEEHKYEFVWTYHHILLDGWSVPILLGEIFGVYECYRNNQTPSLPAEYPYRDYILWLKQQDTASAENFWRNALKGFASPTELSLPKLHNEPQHVATSFYIERTLSATATAQLQAFGRKHALTMNTLVQGAWAILLSRYGGGSDVVFGATVSGRPADLPGSDSMIGLFINTLPVRATIRCRERVVEFLKRLQVDQTEARQYEYASLLDVQRWSDIPRGASLFETLLVFENYPTTVGQSAGDALSIDGLRGADSNPYPLTLVAGPGEELFLKILSDDGQYERATVERMLQHLSTILENLALNPEAFVVDVPMLALAEREQVISTWNRTEYDIGGSLCAHELIEAQALATPDAVAVTLDDKQLTYGELNRRATQLAQYLRKRGVGPEVLVGLCVERSLDMVVGILGILKAGGAYIPLDARYPVDRLHYMIEDSGASVLITQEHLRGLLPTEPTIVSIDAEWEAINRENTAPLNSGVMPENVAYVIYTSGSTGRPKGTILSHRGLVNLALAQSRELRVSGSSRVLQFASFSFDASVWEIFMALPNGATLVLEHADRLASIESLHRVLEAQRITTVLLPPSVLALLPREGLDGLQSLIAGGEACSESLVSTWAPGRRFFNAYGPTEITVCATMARCDAALRGVPAIGGPLPNARVYVLDDHMHPVPVGVAGELYIGGAGVGRGYLRRPEVTAEKFIPDPFSPVAGSRLYRSGDLVRWRQDGQLEYVGRIDQQIKLRGFRIELGEIEGVLRQCEGVEDCAVAVCKPDIGELRLVAFVVGQQISISQLRAYLKERLPAHMIPARFVSLDQLPITVNGKVDRRALQTLGVAHYHRPAFVRPRNLIEQSIADVWSSVLRVERVGAHENFFELGGHSLLATQVASRLRSLFGIEIPLSKLLETPTVAELAMYVAAASKQGVEAEPAILAQRPAEIPLSFSQERLWFIDQLEPGNIAYNIPAALRLNGALSVSAMEWSLNEVIRRHEILRTTFGSIDGRAVQNVLDAVRADIPLIDLTSIPEHDRERAADDEIGRMCRRPFNLSEWPLMRAALIRVRADEHIAVLVLHHIISDGWSMEVLIRELITLYLRRCEGQESPLAELPLQYADYSCWQRKRLTGDLLELEILHWRQQLAGMPTVLELPTDHPHSKHTPQTADVVTFTLPSRISEALSSYSRKQGSTIFMTLMAAFQALLWRYSGQADFGVGTVSANRSRAVLEPLIGFFVNTLVVRARLDRKCTFDRLVENVKHTCLDAYAHQELPFEEVVNALDPERSIDRTPLFQVLFTMQTQQVQAEELQGLKLSPVVAETQAARFDLTLTMAQHADGMSGELAFNSALWDRSTIERMASRFELLLTGALTEPRKPILSLPLATAEERSTCLKELNATALDVLLDTTLPEQFESQAARTPDRIAIRFAGRELTYDQLNRRANALARRLQSAGVKPELPVALSFERSLEMMIALLAVWKAGAPYVPLDPSYPPDRVSFMLADTGAHVALTSAAGETQFTGSVQKVIVVDCDSCGEESENIKNDLSPDNAAYIIFTSGSTGRPKGVVVTHRSVINLAAALRSRMYGKFMGPVCASLNAPLSFDASIKQIILLLDGHTLEIIPEEIRRDGGELLAFVRERRLDVLDTVPAQMKMLVAEGMLDDGGWVPRLLFVGGEAIDLATWQQLAGFRAADVYNMYGPTECTVDATSCHISAHPSVVAIGEPIANLRTYVLDENLEPTALGIPGELYIGGVGVARGYLNRPDLTADRFIPDAYGVEPGARLYRTGDKVRWHADGQIEFLGRFDEQVKVRGYRIELGEIEAVLRSHSGLRDVTVIVREDTPGDRRLVAYCVPCNETLNPSALRAFVSERLPSYMVPSAFMEVAAIPLMPNGKTDKRALPIPDGARDMGRSFDPPISTKEEKLARVWSQLLRVEQVSRNDNFFELGGDSILSIQAVALAKKEGLVFKPRQLFERPTLRALAEVAGEEELRATDNAPVAGEVPLTPVQQKFFAQHTSGPHRFNSSMMLEVHDHLRPDILEKATAFMCAHHDQLRARFTRTVDGWRQEIVDGVQDVPFTYVDMSSTEPDRKTELIESAASSMQDSFDLSAGNLLRVAYFDFGRTGSGRLFFLLHHLVVDGVSWRIFVEDFERVYSQLASGVPPTLAPKTASYQDWAQSLARYAASSEVLSEANYWREVMRQGSPFIACDNPEGLNNYSSMQRYTEFLAEDETAVLLKHLPSAVGVQAVDALLAALVRTFAKRSGEHRLLLQTEGHGREDFSSLDVSRTIGWFTSVYPVALEVGGKDAVADMYAVKEQLARIPRRGITYGLLRYLSPDQLIRDEFSAHPTPEVNFNYLGQFDGGNGNATLLPVRMAEEYVGLEQYPDDIASHKLYVIGVIAGGKLGIRWLFSTNQFHQSTIAELANDYLSELRRLLSETKATATGAEFAAAYAQAN